MEESIRMVYDKANRVLPVIIAKAKELGGFPFYVFTKLYNVSVLSIFSYIAHIGHSITLTYPIRFRITPSAICLGSVRQLLLLLS